MVNLEEVTVWNTDRAVDEDLLFELLMGVVNGALVFDYHVAVAALGAALKDWLQLSV